MRPGFEVCDGRPANIGIEVALIERLAGRRVPRERIVDVDGPDRGGGRSVRVKNAGRPDNPGNGNDKGKGKATTRAASNPLVVHAATRGGRGRPPRWRVLTAGSWRLERHTLATRLLPVHEEESTRRIERRSIGSRRHLQLKLLDGPIGAVPAIQRPVARSAGA